MKSHKLHAIIIGGGIAGPALALLLKKAGMSSTVYEAHPRLEDVGGGFTIAPNGMNVLEEIGIADSVADSGAKVSEFCFRNQSGKVLARYRAGNVEKYRWPSVATSRTTLHQILMEEVARQGIQVEYHKRLKGTHYGRWRKGRRPVRGRHDRAGRLPRRRRRCAFARAADYFSRCSRPFLSWRPGCGRVCGAFCGRGRRHGGPKEPELYCRLRGPVRLLQHQAK